MKCEGSDNPVDANDLTIPKRRRYPVRQIGILLDDGFSLLTVGVVLEVFRLANEFYALRSKAAVPYNVRLISAFGGGVTCSSSIRVWTSACETCRDDRFDVLFIAGGGSTQNGAQHEQVVAWLRDVLPHCGVVKAIGEARSLLEAAQFGGSRQHHEAALASTDADTWGMREEVSDTSDEYEPAKTALVIIKRDLGIEIASEVARRLSFPGAPGLTSLVSDGSVVTVTEKIRASAQWLKDNCDRPISVSDAVRVAAMSERNFLRCFKQEMGMTPSDFLLDARLEMTSRLLTETDWSIDKIARRCGWINGDRLAKIFRRRLALTPSEYRARARSDAKSKRSPQSGD
jgi:transcriptional regulator GlxA family with amidase domain